MLSDDVDVARRGGDAPREPADDTSDVPGQAFAVLDGAHFDDLPAILRGERLFGRSLYLDQADREIEKASPWLLALSQEDAAHEKVVRLVGDMPAMVLWWCAAGEAVLYRHLRGLNVVRIPRWAADGGEHPPVRDDPGIEPAEPVTVFFRNWDPRVLESLLPILDAAQFARVLGPAERLRFRGAVKDRVVIADPRWPTPPSGPLSLTSEQIRSLSDRRIEASRRWIAGYLRDVAPDEIGGANEDEVHRHVLVSEAEGSKLGIRSEQGHARWALLMLMTEGRILSMPDQLRFITKGPRSPDDQVERLIDITVEAMRGQLGPNR